MDSPILNYAESGAGGNWSSPLGKRTYFSLLQVKSITPWDFSKPMVSMVQIQEVLCRADSKGTDFGSSVHHCLWGLLGLVFPSFFCPPLSSRSPNATWCNLICAGQHWYGIWCGQDGVSFLHQTSPLTNCRRSALWHVCDILSQCRDSCDSSRISSSWTSSWTSRTSRRIIGH